MIFARKQRGTPTEQLIAQHCSHNLGFAGARRSRDDRNRLAQCVNHGCALVGVEQPDLCKVTWFKARRVFRFFVGYLAGCLF